MQPEHDSREGGFTLIELLIAIMLSGLLLSGITSGFLVAMKATKGAHERFTESHGAQTLASYFTSDVQSANPAMVDTVNGTATGCAASSADSTRNLVRLQWTENTDAATKAAFSASYRMEKLGSDWQLVRWFCSNTGAPADSVATILGATAPRSHVVARGLGDPRSAFSDGAVTTGSTSYSSLTAVFTSADVGLALAGTQIPVGATISSVSNATTVVMSAAAGSGPGSGLSFTIARPVPSSVVSGSKVSLTIYAAKARGESAPYAYTLSAAMRTPNAAAPSPSFVVSVPATATAGAAVPVTITATTNGTAPDSAYTGAKILNFSGPHASPSGKAPDYPIQPMTFDSSGAWTGTLTFYDAETMALAVSDTAILGTSGNVTVSPGAHHHFGVSAPASVTAGAAFSATVTAQDTWDNTKKTYAGTVHFTSSDAAANLPVNYNFVAGDNGSHQFSGVRLNTAPSQTVAVNDVATPSITGTTTVTVAPPSLGSFTITGAPANTQPNSPFNVTVTAKDTAGNPIPGYTGTVHFTSNDSTATLPVDYPYVTGDGGSHTFSVTLRTLGNRTITVNDTVQTSVTGSTSVVVTPAAVASFTVAAPAAATAGTGFNVVVTAKDSTGNPINGYTGTVHFTSNDPKVTAGAGLPADYTFAAGENGVHTFTGVILKTAGNNKTITVTDTVVTSATGTTATISVSPAAPSVLVFTNCRVNGVGSYGSCSGITLTNGNDYVDGHVSVQDAYGNTPVVTGTLTIGVGSNHAKFVVTNSPVTITGPATESGGTFRVTHTNSGTAIATITATLSGFTSATMTASG